MIRGRFIAEMGLLGFQLLIPSFKTSPAKAIPFIKSPSNRCAKVFSNASEMLLKSVGILGFGIKPSTCAKSKN